jgi:predicted ArsR family transcriptional regulator
MDHGVDDRSIGAVASLRDGVRRDLFDLVSRSRFPVSRDEAARALGLSRRVAATQLDRLVAEGLLAVTFRRLTGRTGPGAGRPSKLYQRAAGEVTVSVPPRHYDLAAELLASAVVESQRSGAPAAEVVGRLAHEAGRELGTEASSLADLLEDAGFQPRRDPAGELVLTNCPFHRLAQRHTGLVCGMNVEFLKGAAEGAGDRPDHVLLDPEPGRCCVRIAESTGSSVAAQPTARQA